MSLNKKWTTSQRDAIYATGGSVLVSAAAGSGKTAVLVQRVIEMITNQENPIDVDRLLIVTFTNAAASEMHERISARISELLSINPIDNNLQRQQILLNKATISTIHSFCNELLREYFYRVNISSNFRIADENETCVIRDEAIDNVLERRYKRSSPEFHLLIEMFSNSKDDSPLVSVIKLAYKFITAHPYPDLWVNNQLNMYKNVDRIEDTLWGKVILQYTQNALSYCIEITDTSLKLAQSDNKLFQAVKLVLESDKENFNLMNCLGWDATRKWLDEISFKVLRAPRGYIDHPIKLKIVENRKEVKDSIKKVSKLFVLDAEICKNDINKLFLILRELFDIIKDFSDEFSKLKLDKNIIDFTDLEQLSVKLLTVPVENGFQRTSEAILIGERFDEIMVDEYQDTNETQDTIFRAISNNEENFFVVGDVKQSIYGFRQAMPEIFLRRKESYSKYDSKVKNYPSRITLGNNFRSREGVTEAVNFVFKQLMSREVGDMEYSEEDSLIATADYNAKSFPDTEINLIDLESCDDHDMDVIEARYISKIINEKIKAGVSIRDGEKQRNVQYSDFCILLRSTKGHASVFVNELERNGIPAWSELGNDFFSSTEICIVLSFLRIIDNPLQDVPLLALLMSPIVMLNVDDVSKIRLTKKDGPLYFALKLFVSNVEDSRLKNLMDQIDRFRYLSETTSCSKLIRYIYEQNDLSAIVQTMKNGGRRLNNLKLLVNYASVYEKSGYKSLSSFITFIDKIRNSQGSFITPSVASESSNVVRVMSIHRSKGLEFPICIIANCSRKFNKERKEIVFDSKLGVGIKFRDIEKFSSYTTFIREAILLETGRSYISEELRILYVAMTRAKENLIMICSFKNMSKKLQVVSTKVFDKKRISSYVVRGASSFAEWILMCLIKHPSASNIRKRLDLNDDIVFSQSNEWKVNLIEEGFEIECNSNIIEKGPINNNREIDKVLLDTIRKRFQYEYPMKKLSGIPAKISVSEISHDNLIGEEFSLSRPAFMNQHGMTAMEKGTALHAFLQFADLKSASESLQEHINFLLSKGFITNDQALIIDKERIKKFLKTDVVQRIMKSKNVLREFRFNMNINVQDFISDLEFKDEKIILQGAIDCAFEENGEFVIIDYKTDLVKSTYELVERYKRQLNFYRKAIEECTRKRVKACMIYSFYHNEFSIEF